MNAPQVRERGILFSGPMVRAILAGRKTQTRRAVKPSVRGAKGVGAYTIDGVVDDLVNLDEDGDPIDAPSIRCPYGAPGDRLWSRETHAPRYFDDGRTAYRADWTAPDGLPEPKWTPSILMPRWASRITLEITGVRVERAHDISDADIAAEGVDAEAVEALWQGATRTRRFEAGYLKDKYFSHIDGWPKAQWAAAWTLINGRASWDANPWVWVVEFKVVTP